LTNDASTGVPAVAACPTTHCVKLFAYIYKLIYYLGAQWFGPGVPRTSITSTNTTQPLRQLYQAETAETKE